LYTAGSICTLDFLSDWEYLSDEDYRSKKVQVAGILLERLKGIHPGIKNAVDSCDVGMAKTIRRYKMNPASSVY